MYGLLQKENVDCAFIYSGSKDQNMVAKKWNDNTLQVLITTTLGLVGNESSRTQMVCIVGMHYNLPSIVQSYGRIRPKRRTRNSQCLIFTSTNNYGRLRVAEIDSEHSLNELVGSGIVSSVNRSKYKRSMTMSSVNDWLFKDQGCRLVSLAKRLGFKHVERCSLCDMCTDTCIVVSSRFKAKQVETSNLHRKIGERLLLRMKQKCLCCNSVDCIGTCVVTRMKGIVCFHCLGNHYASKCPKEYKTILRGKACYSCYTFNYSEDKVHEYKECSGAGGIKERLRGLIQYDYLEKKKRNETSMSFLVHLSGIFASADAFFMFLYKYRDWK